MEILNRFCSPMSPAEFLVDFHLSDGIAALCPIVTEIHIEMDTGGVSPVVKASASARKNVSTACEACRAAKIKCQQSKQPGVCHK